MPADGRWDLTRRLKGKNLEGCASKCGTQNYQQRYLHFLKIGVEGQHATPRPPHKPTVKSVDSEHFYVGVRVES